MAKPPPPTATTSPSDPPPPKPRPLGLLSSSARSLLAAARRSPVTTLVVAFFLLALFMYGEDVRTIAELSIDDYLYPDADLYNVSGLPPLVLPPPTCDLSDGRWVFDNVSLPAYREKECTFLTKQVTCLANGRPDDTWQYWKWQPNECSLPTRFDARRFMETMRGKRLMFVGDSLNRNQWESLVCLVQPILSKGRKKIVKRGSLTIFHAKEYRATLEFYWAPFLVESNSDNPKIHSIEHRIIRPERIEGHAKYWKDVDYLIFNTYIWWMNTADMKVRRPNSRYWSQHDEVPRIEAYGRVFKTWSEWLNNNIDPAHTSVFFMTISPLHISPKNWGNPEGIRCVKETLPYQNYSQPLDLYHDMRMFDLVVKVASSMEKVPVTVINITRMSDYRKDAHTSLYSIRQGKLLTPKQKADPEKFADCIHWCLPGVPDVWNQILYTRILSKSSWHSNFAPPPLQSLPPPQ
ncbi:protein trichome birefringence-like 28 [Panicum miliaceum]|uniref:Protein trichome birefringence-like 28 n=1 Tax=Panicum miliaceum TaxID=4540 RepID=A0A3L6PG30_PANMI|nr:protein trichome birefringence-like 28 [Panicum miliaceum]